MVSENSTGNGISGSRLTRGLFLYLHDGSLITELFQKSSLGDGIYDLTGPRPCKVSYQPIRRRALRLTSAIGANSDVPSTANRKTASSPPAGRLSASRFSRTLDHHLRLGDNSDFTLCHRRPSLVPGVEALASSLPAHYSLPLDEYSIDASFTLCQPAKPN